MEKELVEEYKGYREEMRKMYAWDKEPDLCVAAALMVLAEVVGRPLANPVPVVIEDVDG